MVKSFCHLSVSDFIVSKDRTPKRNRPPRTVPRTKAESSIPVSHFSPIKLTMTFSDAEEDHPSNTQTNSNPPPRYVAVKI